MNKKWFDKFKEILPGKQIEQDDKGNIIVKNIDNSLVCINPLNTDDLQNLRQEISDDNQDQFNELILEFKKLVKKNPRSCN
jgi:hypothetical protein